MRLNSLFTPKNKKTAPELFLAVEIHESLIKTAVWQVEEETPSVLSLGSFEMWDSEDSLINGLDASLTEATKGLSSQPDRVIFGLPASWLVDNKIHPSKQGVIKKIIKDLDLKPVGMVTIAEAIISHFKTQEGVPPTAILLEIYPLKVVVSLINTGNIVATEEVGRSDDLSRDVEEGLARMEVEKLPARFLLTNGSDLENEIQQITSYPWTDKLPFLHLPKVQALPIDFSIRAIALSGGVEVAKSLGLEIVTPQEEVETNKTENTKEEKDDSPAASIGFTLESDGSTESTPIISEEEPIGIENEVKESSEENLVEIEDSPPPSSSHLGSLFTKIKNFRPSVPSKLSLPSFSLPNFNAKRRIFWVIPPLVILLFVLSVSAFYLFAGSVDIEVRVTPKRENRSLDLAIATSVKPDVLTLVAEQKTLSAKASDNSATTGEAVVGDKAKGKVTVYNLTAAPLSLKSGTQIVASTGQAYILDRALEVASRSAQTEPPFTITPGSASVDVTAGKIGAEYNLDKGTQFSVDNYPKSNVIASADNTLSGGSSRTVKAVSKTDQDKLTQTVTQKIRSQIENDLKGQDPDLRLLTVGDIKYTTTNFSHKIGEEATNFSLDLEGEQNSLVYSYQSLLNLIQQEILKSSEVGLTVVPDQTSISLSDPKVQADGSFLTKADASLTLLPQFSSEDYANLIKGKSASKVKEILERIPGFEEAFVSASPKLPLLQRLMPLNASNIHIVLVTK